MGVVLVMLLFKVPSIPSILCGSISGFLVAWLYQGQSFTSVTMSMWSGYVLESDNAFIAKIFSRGGITSMSGGPNLLFITLPNIFNAMSNGRLWGSLFFLFMVFAAITTVIAVIENIVTYGMDLTGCSRKKSASVNLVLLLLLSLPCVFGFNIWKSFEPLGRGTSILDLEDFILSNNLLPLGSLVFLLFCTR